MQITIADFKEMQAAEAPLELIDVRSPEEYADHHLDGARNIPMDQLASGLTTADKDAPLVLVCLSGQRSLQATGFLRSVGFKNALSLEGGMRAWDAEQGT